MSCANGGCGTSVYVQVEDTLPQFAPIARILHIPFFLNELRDAGATCKLGLRRSSKARSIVVYRGLTRQQSQEGIEILPWRMFCNLLWSGELLAG
jgi:hypothetical protein